MIFKAVILLRPIFIHTGLEGQSLHAEQKRFLDSLHTIHLTPADWSSKSFGNVTDLDWAEYRCLHCQRPDAHLRYQSWIHFCFDSDSAIETWPVCYDFLNELLFPEVMVQFLDRNVTLRPNFELFVHASEFWYTRMLPKHLYNFSQCLE